MWYSLAVAMPPIYKLLQLSGPERYTIACRISSLSCVKLDICFLRYFIISRSALEGRRCSDLRQQRGPDLLPFLQALPLLLLSHSE